MSRMGDFHPASVLEAQTYSASSKDDPVSSQPASLLPPTPESLDYVSEKHVSKI